MMPIGVERPQFLRAPAGGGMAVPIARAPIAGPVWANPSAITAAATSVSPPGAIVSPPLVSTINSVATQAGTNVPNPANSNVPSQAVPYPVPGSLSPSLSSSLQTGAATIPPLAASAGGPAFFSSLPAPLNMPLLWLGAALLLLMLLAGRSNPVQVMM